jgi:hypothetical protein
MNINVTWNKMGIRNNHCSFTSLSNIQKIKPIVVHSTRIILVIRLRIIVIIEWYHYYKNRRHYFQYNDGYEQWIYYFLVL